MRKSFVVAVSGLTNDEEKSFVEFIRKKKMGWWHRIANFWLIVDHSGAITTYEIRDFLTALNGSKIGLVLENPSSDRWAGFASADKLDETFAWMERTWEKPESG